jgi:hypothetical protein
MNKKPIILLLVLLIITQPCFQGCAAISRNVKEKTDIYNAKNLGSCSLLKIEYGDYVKLMLDNGYEIRGKIVRIKHGEAFYLKHIFNRTNYGEETVIAWSRIIKAEKLEMIIDKSSLRMPIYCGMGIIAAIVFMLVQVGFRPLG